MFFNFQMVRKKLKGSYFMTQENCTKFKFVSINKVDQNIALLICISIIYGCFYVTTAG